MQEKEEKQKQTFFLDLILLLRKTGLSSLDNKDVHLCGNCYHTFIIIHLFILLT